MFAIILLDTQILISYTFFKQGAFYFSNHGYEPQSKLRNIKPSASRDCFQIAFGYWIIRLENFNARCF